jgi:hypothetical protein
MWIEPLLVSNATASLSLFALLAWFASSDIRRCNLAPVQHK